MIGYKPRIGFCFKNFDLSDIQLANCMPDKWRFLKQRPTKKVVELILIMN